MNAPAHNEHIIPYRAWWGLAVCGLLIGVVLGLGPYHEFEILPRQHPFDYPWKLSDPTFWSRFSAWSLYALHQIGIWYLIYKAQSQKLRYINGLHKINVQALILNVGFIGLHILQTKLFYDGLAQDVHEATAFGSVALMLFVIYIMENARRSMFFGKPAPLPAGLGPFLRRYAVHSLCVAIT